GRDGGAIIPSGLSCPCYDWRLTRIRDLTACRAWVNLPEGYQQGRGETGMGIRVLTAASVMALFAGSAQAEMVLHILHTNDLHSRIEPINKYDSTCDA